MAEELARRDARVAELEAQLAASLKNSGNSSKPPSSDIVKPPKPKGKGRRKQGGQPGHARHERPAFPPDQINEGWEYRLFSCPDCGGHLRDAKEAPRCLQQVELAPQPVIVTEHCGIAQWCHKCQKLHYGTWPAELTKAGLFGPQLTALVGFLKGACHMSFSGIRKYFRDVIKVHVSRGMLAKLVQKVSQSLQDPYEALLLFVKEQDRLNVDETGHKDRGKRHWTWCFRALTFTLYKVSPSRGCDVLLDVLGMEFNGVLGCDYFSAYRKYMRLNENALLQFCLAHFIRDVKFLAEHSNAKNRTYGQRLVEDLRKLFHTLHRRESYASETTFRRALQALEDEICLHAIMDCPETREAENLCRRFTKHGEAFFRFITTPNVEPTNNLAEQAIRFVAIHRRITQGTRGQKGQTWCERIWTAIATCAQQGRSVYEYLCQAIEAYFQDEPSPSLLGDTS